MEPLEEKVSSALRGHFGRTAKVQLKDDDGIIGSVTSAKFRDLRNRSVNMIWECFGAIVDAEEHGTLRSSCRELPRRPEGTKTERLKPRLLRASIRHHDSSLDSDGPPAMCHVEDAPSRRADWLE